MRLNKKKFFEILDQGESDSIEFKTRFVNERSIAVSLIAFANSNGGHLIIGVTDEKNIIGLTNNEIKITTKRLQKICESLFSTGYVIEVLNIDNHKIIDAYINKAPDHLRPISTSEGEIYIRQGAKNIKTQFETRRIYNETPEIIEKKKIIIGFVAMSFRVEEEPALTDYFNAMIRAAKNTGLPIELTRIDLQERDYEISQEIMNEIDRADFVIADFTLNPHNVYFEIGYARGVKKPIIQTSRKDTSLQFDVRNWSTLFYRNATELEESLIGRIIQVYKDLP